MLRLYNSYTKRKEVFRPRNGKWVTMYNCGPTVYDFVHIGNLRSFLFADILRRYLEYRGYKVKQIMNITDVGHMTTDADAGEDKMSVAAKREGKEPIEVARFYEGKFMEDMKSLGVTAAAKYPRASEHIPEMLKLVKKLLKKGHAYLVPENVEATFRSPDGGLKTAATSAVGSGASVYYDLSTFPRYGKLSGNKVDDLLAGARVDVISEKRNPYDFALWIYKPNHLLQWSSPWGAGYPGWHLECSAMSMKYLGATIDIHTGGEDNIFPHHECEIAQSEGATGKQFVRVWLHVKHLLVDGKKMSKSLGNFYTLKDLLEKGISPRAVRYLLVSTHYRDAFNFTLDGLGAAEGALKRVDELVARLQQVGIVRESARRRMHFSARGGSALGMTAATPLLQRARREFIRAMDDDLNISKALAVLFEFVRAINVSLEKGISDTNRRQAMKLLQEFDKVLGFGISQKKQSEIPTAVLALVEQREDARIAKDWALSDRLREEIRLKGFEVKDTQSGPLVKLIK
ncbi:MAG: cysteine--tRNA ligase [bacterium]|nr:cysteine--tRNA ligase [bacterium]